MFPTDAAKDIVAKGILARTEGAREDHDPDTNSLNSASLRLISFSTAANMLSGNPAALAS